MDSMSNLMTPHSNYTVKGIKRFLIAMGVIRDDVLTPVPVKVSLYFDHTILHVYTCNMLGLPAKYINKLWYSCYPQHDSDCFGMISHAYNAVLYRISLLCIAFS